MNSTDGQDSVTAIPSPRAQSEQDVRSNGEELGVRPRRGL
jgi:hypothetical protein